MASNLTNNFLNGKHLVVFGAGYVGGAVAAEALAVGARVTALTRNPETARHLGLMGCDVVVADLAQADWYDQICEPDFVLNSVSSGRRGLEGYLRSYREGAQSIITWGQKLSLGTVPLVYTSSTSVYAQDHGQTMDESMPADAEDERGKLLLAAEALLTTWPGPTSILRLAGIYGPGRHYLLDQMKSAPLELPGIADHHLNLIHRDDIVSAVFASWARTTAFSVQIYNLVDDGRATRREIVEWLAQQLGLAVPRITGISAPGRRAVRPDRIVRNDKIKSALGWRPRYPTFRDGYADLLLGA
jgi:nucleoside-diphosphate-sugar epimerase